MTYKYGFLSFVAGNRAEILIECGLLDVGDTFVFKGDRCKVTKTSKKGFNYRVITDDLPDGYMTWSFYVTTPSFKGRNI